MNWNGNCIACNGDGTLYYICPAVSHLLEFIGHALDIHWTPIGYPWDTHGTPMGHAWDTHGTPMGHPWDTENYRTDRTSAWKSLSSSNVLWSSFALFTVNSRCPMGVPWVSHGCPMGVPWVSNGCPMSVIWTVQGAFGNRARCFFIHHSSTCLALCLISFQSSLWVWVSLFK